MEADHAFLGVWTWSFKSGQTLKDFKQGIDFFFPESSSSLYR